MLAPLLLLHYQKNWMDESIKLLKKVNIMTTLKTFFLSGITWTTVVALIIGYFISNFIMNMNIGFIFKGM